MGLPDTRIRSLETARECIALGACQRTVCWVTGLTKRFARHNIFVGTIAPRGRPPYSDELLIRASPQLKVEISVFAKNYRQLRNDEFSPVQSLLTAYRHQAESMGSSPSFSFDQAFYLVANLDGIWACRSATLAMASCLRCGASHLAPIGSERTNACPFCSGGREPRPVTTSLVKHSGAGRLHQVDGDATAALDRLIHRAKYERRLELLGAHPRIVHVLSESALPIENGPKIPMRSLRYWNEKWKGRPHDLTIWNRSVKPIVRVQYSMLAVTYRRLIYARLTPEAALQSAYQHTRMRYSDKHAIGFNRAFEIISLLEGRWDAEERQLHLTRCSMCGSLHLESKVDPAGADCPFCSLMRKPAVYDHALALPAARLPESALAPLTRTA